MIFRSAHITTPDQRKTYRRFSRAATSRDSYDRTVPRNASVQLYGDYREGFALLVFERSGSTRDQSADPVLRLHRQKGSCSLCTQARGTQTCVGRLSNVYPPFSKIINFSSLKRLGLANCTGIAGSTGAYEFLSQVASDAGQKGLSLEHIALDVSNSPGAVGSQNREFDICLDNLLDACLSLVSLHFVNSKLEALPPAIEKHIQTRGRELKLLSLLIDNEFPL